MGLFDSLIYQAGRLTGKAVSAAKSQIQESMQQAAAPAPAPAPQPELSPWERRLRQAQQPGTPPEEKFEIGMAYLNAEGPEYDEEQAVRWFRSAAEDGYGPGETALAKMYLEEMYQCPEEEALRLLKNCADRDLAPMQNHLALFYENHGDHRNYIRYLEMARQNGEPAAWNNLALEYAVGGVLKRDPERANRYFREAAELGDCPAQIMLYHQYHIGDGVEQDPEAAEYWLQKAAENEDEEAFLNTAKSYEAAGDMESARILYARAAQQGNEEAEERLNALG